MDGLENRPFQIGSQKQMTEIWKSIPSYSNYKVSNLGNIKRNNKIMQVNQPNYCRIRLYEYKKTAYLHRLICEAFYGKNNKQVNHKNGIKNDNRLVNLEYVTCRENILHSYKTGLASNKGSNNPSHKLNERDVNQIKKLLKKKKLTHKQIGAIFNVSRDIITKINNKRNWNT